MKEKLTRFIDNTVGHFIEVSYSPALYQCMDLAYEWIFILDFPKSTIQHQYAYEVYTQATDFTRQYFDIIPNKVETIPQEGDLVIFNKTSSNIAGHIAVVIEATQSKMKVYEQNSPVGSHAHISDRTYTGCLGFLRPKFKTEGGVPQYLTTLFNEAGLRIEQEAEVRAYLEKSKKYDQEIQSLRGQLTSTNEALSSKSTELANEISKVEGLQRSIDEYQEKLNTIGSKNDSLTTDKIRLEVEVERLTKENSDLQEKIIQLEGEKPLMAYTWKERFWSLIRG